MKDKETIIKELEDEILIRETGIREMQSEVNAMQLTVAALRNPGPIQLIQSSQTKAGPKTLEYPGYPFDGDLLAKLNFLENIKLKFWKAKTMEELIMRIEEREITYSTTNNFRQALSTLVKKCEIINMKYNDSLQYCFYATRREWIEPIQVGTLSTYVPLKEHAPDKLEIENLTQDQLKPENIKWRGIK